MSDKDGATAPVTDAEFETKVGGASKPVIVDFWAEWCAPCHQLAPALEAVAEQMSDKVTVLKLNIDENPEAAAKYNVRSIPTLVLFKNGTPAATQVGVLTKSALENWVTSNT